MNTRHLFIRSMDAADDDLRLQTVRWIDDEFKLIIDLLQSGKLTQKEQDELQMTYKELGLRYAREKNELKRLGKI